MTIQFSLTRDKSNTQAPLGLLLARYKQKQVLQSLEDVRTTAKTIDFSTVDKLQQILISILAGCDTISEVNTQLKKGDPLAGCRKKKNGTLIALISLIKASKST